MPTLNKEMENKTSVFEMQLTTEQRVFVVKMHYKTSWRLTAEYFQRKSHQETEQYGKT